MNRFLIEEPNFSDVKLNHVRGGGSSVSMRNMAQSSDAGNSGRKTWRNPPLRTTQVEKQGPRNLFYLIRSHHM
jgi:hypothetical protein